jgi:DNA-binding XRE family transcriptional regulator
MTLTKVQDNSNEFDAFKLAIAVLANRIASLPPADKEDLFELTKILFSATSEEERTSAMRAMDEIMLQRPLKLARVEEPADPTKGLENWLGFVSWAIREHRIEAGLSQTELAERTGLTQSHISRLENGEHSPSHTTIAKIAAALGISASKLDPSAE